MGFEKELNDLNSKIFTGYDIDTLDSFQKRRIIFDYLCNNFTYDYDRLVELIIDKIYSDKTITSKDKLMEFYKKGEYEDYIYDAISKKISNGKYIRNRESKNQDIYNLFHKQIGMCHTISYLYQILLEMNNIYSALIICDNMMPVNHEVVLVDNGDGSYSFDDVTSVITGIGSIEDCFSYDYEGASLLNQGLRSATYLNLIRRRDFDLNKGNSFGLIFSREFTYLAFGIKSSFILSDEEYKLERSGLIPKDLNICSINSYIK
jgi:hypothetical protein